MHTDDSVSEVYFALCKTVDTPVSLGAWLRFKYTQTELASMELNPETYNDPDSFFLDYSVVSLLSKYKGLKTGIDLDAVALQKFKTSETACQETNRRFRSLETIRNGWLHSVLYTAQKKISRLLGPFSLFKICDRYGWGPGASLDIPRRRAFVDAKLTELPISVSRSARSLLRNEIENDLHWSYSILGLFPEGPYSLLDSNFVIADACRIDTVPKSAKTNRVIAVEPRGNSFLQKGFGGYFRDRLRTVGINLDDQTVNQRWASQAHLKELATLDLRAASDTVSLEVVYHLLPYEWASAMDAVRSRKAVMPDGSTIVLEKFSSMGNGFTFELETLIFWALCSAVNEVSGRRGVVAVYGDDIIVDRISATDVALTLQFCGFELNDQKSFFSGPFFESCGKHYFLGQDVTPAYQKDEVDQSDLLSGIRLGNRLIRLAFRLGRYRSLCRQVKPAWDCVRRIFGSPELCIPFPTEGDDAWCAPINDFVFWKRQHPVDLINHGIRCKVLATQLGTLPGNDSALLAWSMRRGVVTPVPYEGVVSYTPRVSRSRPSLRRVIPDGRFCAIWT